MTVKVEKQLADLLRSIYRRLDLYHDEFLQLPPKELAFLLILDELKHCRVKDLAARVNLPLSTVSWTIDRMVTEGFISRKTDPTDRRAIILSLAKSGHKALAKHREVFDKVSQVAMANLSNDEKKQILALISKASTFF